MFPRFCHAFWLVVSVTAACVPFVSAQPAEPALDQVVRRMAAYVAGYGAQASIVVAVEKYTQQFTREGRLVRPRTLVSEFAIVRAAGQAGWTGFRDVVEVDGRAVADRRDRLLSLLTGPAGGESEFKRIADESARYNVGPIARNLNVPTAALFFFHPQYVGRFAFERKGRQSIEGVSTWVLDFKETGRPTIIVKRDGTSVPCEGTVWVVPADGTIVRTRLRLRNFANTTVMRGGTYESGAPRARVPRESVMPAPTTSATLSGSKGSSGQTSGASSSGAGKTTTTTSGDANMGREFDAPDLIPEIVEIETLADIDVTYQREAGSGMWLPSKMTELYEGPLGQGTRRTLTGRVVGSAKYSDYKRFETSVRIVLPK